MISGNYDLNKGKQLHNFYFCHQDTKVHCRLYFVFSW